jgi:alpha-D-xyloside xylohydrolase
MHPAPSSFDSHRHERLTTLAWVDSHANGARFASGTHEVRIDARANGVFRLRIGTSERPSYDLLVDPETAIPASTEAIDGGWRIAAGDSALELVGDPLRVRVLHKGRVLIESATDEHFRGYARVPAFGVEQGGPMSWCVGLALASDDAVYGLGEKFGPLNKRGQFVRGRIEDALGVNTELSYKNIPFAWGLGTRGGAWGVFVHTPGTVQHGVGFPGWSQRSYVLEIEDDALDLFLMTADAPAEVLRQYARETGLPAPVPKWSLGLWMSRAYYKTPEECAEVAADIRRRRIPCDVITLDGRAAWATETRVDWRLDPARFTDPKAQIAAIKAQGLRVCVWEYPYVSVHSPLFATLADKGWFLKRADGRPYVFEWVKNPKDSPFGAVLTPLAPSAAIDFTHPDANAYWRDAHRGLFELGVDVMKSDFGEQIEDDMHAHNGDTGRRLHNAYPLLYNRCVFEATRRYSPSCTGADAEVPMVWGRDAFTGSQAHPMQWGGDPQSDWEGLAASVRGALGLGASGIPYYATDVGGFYGRVQPSAELMLRWTAQAVFCSHMRYHGIGLREPWAFGDATEALCRRWIELRYRLIPYIAAACAEATETALPLMRAMALAFPHDLAARGFEGQYLFGPSLLVAPIMNGDGEATVCFPREANGTGAWYDLFTGERFEAGTTQRVRKPLDQAPVYGREGHVLPLGRRVQSTAEIDWAQPVESLWAFGLPRVAPTACGITLHQQRGQAGVRLTAAAEVALFAAPGAAIATRREGHDWIIEAIV